MRSLAPWSSLLLLGAPLSTWALSLGEIEGNSFLNQPLDAEIPFTATAQELEGLRVSMAPLSVFAAEGVDYSPALESIEFSIGRNDRGENVIRVRSTRLITEPFVTLLVEVRSGRSTFYREFSVLLDPPLYLPPEAPAEPIAAPATRDAAPGGQIERQPEAAPAPAPAPVASAEPAAAPAQRPAPAGGGDYTVQAGDTLWGIAQRVRPAGVSTNQTMISIFEANRAAFNDNINILRRGAILRIPPDAELGGLAAAAATAEVLRQNEAWQSGAAAEPRLVLIPPSEDSDASGVLAGLDNSAEVSALEGEIADLESELESVRSDLAEAERLLELRDAELAAVQSLGQEPADVAVDEEAVVDEPVAEAGIGAEPEASAEPESVFADEAAIDEATAGETAADETAADEAGPEAAAIPVVSTEASGPSLMDRIIGAVTRPIVFLVGGIVIVLFAGLAFLRRRREQADDVTGQWEALEAELEQEAGSTTANLRVGLPESDMVVVEGDGTATVEEPVAEDFGSAFDEPDFGAATDAGAATGTVEIPPPANFHEDEPTDIDEAAGAAAAADGTSEAHATAEEEEPPLADQTLSSQTVINLDHEDPIAEADFHMAYGLYDQAADLIVRALEDDPDNLELRLKLLEVYFVWDNKDAFLEQARAFRNDLAADGGKDWDKVVIMGKQICPDEPVFSEATAAAGEVDLDLEASPGDAPSLDFSLDENDDDGIDLDFGIDDDDEDGAAAIEPIGEYEATVEIAGDDDVLGIGARTQAGLEAALFEEIGDDDAAGATTDSDDSDAEGTLETPAMDLEATGNFDTGAFDTGDTMEQPGPGSTSLPSADMTAEIAIDDLGLDVGGIGDDADEDTGERAIDFGEDPEAGIDAEAGAAAQADTDADADTETEAEADSMPAFSFDIEESRAGVDAHMLSATGVTQVLDAESGDAADKDAELSGTGIFRKDDATQAMSRDPAATGTTTEVLEQPGSRSEPAEPQVEDVDFDIDDFSSALEGSADTVDQPLASGFADIGLDEDEDIGQRAEMTGTDHFGPLDPQTMTEVGTKLDLARAYIDMGDPEGAKSILEEVLSEGDQGQRTEAKTLISALSA